MKLGHCVDPYHNSQVLKRGKGKNKRPTAKKNVKWRDKGKLIYTVCTEALGLSLNQLDLNRVGAAGKRAIG